MIIRHRAVRDGTRVAAFSVQVDVDAEEFPDVPVEEPGHERAPLVRWDTDHGFAHEHPFWKGRHERVPIEDPVNPASDYRDLYWSCFQRALYEWPDMLDAVA